VSKEALPTAAALLEAAKERRLMDVVLPNGQKLGDHRLPGDYFLLDHLTPFGRALRDLTGEEVAQVEKFYGGLSAAMEIHLRMVPGGKR